MRSTRRCATVVPAPDPYRLIIAPSARRQLAEVLPEAVAFAAHEFIIGPLIDNPHRVGKRLRPPLDDRHSARRGTYRVIYRIDDQLRTVAVVGVFPRSEAYRTR
jgi:mRNA interferase RelE/StbE